MNVEMTKLSAAILTTVAVGTLAGATRAAPATPSGPHPRLFMSAANLAAYTANAAKTGTAAAGLVAACQDTIDSPNDYATRGGSDGNNWPGSAVACAFSYAATRSAQHLAQALKYWQASLDDDQNIGDHLGCVAGVNTSWQAWAANRNGPAPPVLITITHDTGYPIRWYGPDIALAYDWLYGAPGVTDALRVQTRVCLGNWLDYYTKYGYHRDEAGANYNAGFVVAKALGAVGSTLRRSRTPGCSARRSFARASRATSWPRARATAQRARR